MIILTINGLPCEVIENVSLYKCINCSKKFFTQGGAKRHSRTACNSNRFDKRQIDWIQQEGINNDNRA